MEDSAQLATKLSEMLSRLDVLLLRSNVLSGEHRNVLCEVEELHNAINVAVTRLNSLTAH